MTRRIVLKETQGSYTVDPAEVGDEPLILERGGKPVAAVIPFDDYRRFAAWQNQQEDEAWRRAQIDALADEKVAFDRQKPQLLMTHRGQWVAIYSGAVMDSDPDQRALVKRVYSQTAQRPIYFVEVSEAPRVYEVPSPESIR